MIVVSDTSPINYLVLIGAAHVLPPLFQQVYIPNRVAAEMRSPDAPDAVRNWISSPPPWLRIQEPQSLIANLRLDPGETAAISLACEMKADHLLIDEWAGRKVAQSKGLNVIGTLGVLYQAAGLGLVQLNRAFDLLRTTTFRANQALMNQLLAADALRRTP